MTGFAPDPSNGDPMAGYGSGMLLGPIAQMATTDPRRLLVQSLIGQGQQALSHPMYSKFSALANALAAAAGPYAAGQLNKQYQGLNQDYINQLRQAYLPQAAPATAGPPATPTAPAEAPPAAASAPIQATPLPPVGSPQPASQDALFSNLERQYGLPTGTLGRLMQTESSGVPRPGPALPSGQHANGYFQFTPETAARYGVTPGDLTSEATGAAQYLADLTKRNGGNFSKALVDYGGFQTKDPSRYIGNVTGGPPGTQLAQATPQVQPAQQQAPSVAPQPSAGVPGADPVAAQIAIARQMAASPNPVIAYQGIQSLQALQQGRALAYEKAYGTESGTGAAKLSPTTGEAAQIAARTPAEASEAGAKAQATSQATLPSEVLKSILTPQINRVTGAQTIPGLDPNTMARTRAVLGLPPLAGPQAAPETSSVSPPAAPPPQQQSPVPYGSKSPADEVPSVKLPSGELPLQPGEISPGRDPVAITAGEKAIEQAQEQYKETEERARGAATIHSQIANMRQQVQSGDVTPSMLAPARAFVSSLINALPGPLGGPQNAKAISGMDPAATDVVSKEATQMGTQYARETEGARQAVAGINIALKANPQLSNSKDGFLKILDILDAGAKHDLASQEYGNAFFQKNQHYVGFQPWMNQNHPPEEFVSKVVPLDVPRLQDGSVDRTRLQPNVTYRGQKGPGIWTGQGFQMTPQ